MLVDVEVQSKITGTVNALGVQLSNSTLNRKMLSYLPGTVHFATPLEEAYFLGKVAGILGPDQLQHLQGAELSRHTERMALGATELDKATLSQLEAETQTWINGRNHEWNSRTEKVLTVANRDWQSVLEGRIATDETRTRALRALRTALDEVLDQARHETDRLVQTEILKYFQKGQVRELKPEEPVYKIPRAEACVYCLDLHLNSDGSPKTRKVGDVHANSNLDARPAYWDFTVGPTHPHCYCVLYAANLNPPPGPNPRLAAYLSKAKRPS